MEIEINDDQVEALRQCLESQGEIDEWAFIQLKDLYATATGEKKSESKEIPFTEVLSQLYSPLNVRAKLPEWGGYWYVDNEFMLCDSEGEHVESSRIAMYAERKDWIIEIQ